MASVLIIDLSHCYGGETPSLDRGVRPPMSWQCAATMSRQFKDLPALQQAWNLHHHQQQQQGHDDLEQGSGHASHSGCSYNIYNTPFSIAIANKYFECSVQPTIGHWSPSPADRSLNEAADHVERTTEEAVHSYVSSMGSTRAFGGVLIAHSSQDPSRMPWHILPAARSLFRVLLLVVDDSTSNNNNNNSNSVVNSKKSVEAWRQACAAQNNYELIVTSMHQLLEVMPNDVAGMGLLAAPQDGAAGLLHILSNTLWPKHVRESSLSSTTKTHSNNMGSKSTGDRSDVMNTFVVVAADGVDAFSQALLPRRQEKKNKNNNDSISTNTSGVYTTRRGGYSTIAHSPNEWLLCNKYYTAVIAPSFLPLSLFDYSMQDALLMQWEESTSVVSNDNKNNSMCVSTVFVLWPPEHKGDDGGRLMYPSLDVVIDKLQCTLCGVEDVKLIAHGTTPLNAFEAARCQERGVEVVYLDDALMMEERGSCDGDDDGAEGPQGLDRLHECLHCMAWAATAPSALGEYCRGDEDKKKSVNDADGDDDDDTNECLLCVCGGATASEEESWAIQVLNTLQGADSSSSKSNSSHLPPSLTPIHQIAVANNYFSATVSLTVLGGWRSCLWQSRRDASAWTDAPVQADQYGAVIIACTLDALRNGAHFAELSNAHTYAGSTIPFLVDVVSRVQHVLYMQQQGSIEHLLGDYKGDDGSIDEGDTSSSMTAILFVVDGDAAGTDDQLVEEYLSRIIKATYNNKHGEKENGNRNASLRVVDSDKEKGKEAEDEDEDAECDYPLIERTFPELEGGSSSGGECEGLARIREALQQHPWPLVNAASGNAQSLSDRAPTTGGAETGDGEDPIISTPSGGTLRIGCELPDSFLIDPRTGRSQHIPALRHYQSQMEHHHDDAQNSDVVNNKDNSNSNNSTAVEDGYHEELIRWMELMKSHGKKLSPADRQRQAGLLALALEAAMS